MNKYYFYVNDSTDPYYNLAFEEYILTHYTIGSIFLLWQNNNTIVIGQHQNAIEEINKSYVDEHDITVVRRTTGGGAVYHDMGNLNYSFIMDYDPNGEISMSEFVKPVIHALKTMGVTAEFTGRNDITIDGKKVSGTAQRIYKNRILHHGCLLVNADLSVVGKALNVKKDKFQSKAVQSIRSRVGNIMEYLDDSYTMDKFKDAMIKDILADENHHNLVLTNEDLAAIQELRDNKYANWEWNFGRSPACSIHNYNKFDGGSVEVYLNIDKNNIQDITIYGDFMALKPVTDITNRLIGCPYNYDNVLTIFNEFLFHEYFGSIEPKDVAKCICCME